MEYKGFQKIVLLGLPWPYLRCNQPLSRINGLHGKKGGLASTRTSLYSIFIPWNIDTLVNLMNSRSFTLLRSRGHTRKWFGNRIATLYSRKRLVIDSLGETSTWNVREWYRWGVGVQVIYQCFWLLQRSELWHLPISSRIGHILFILTQKLSQKVWFSLFRLFKIDWLHPFGDIDGAVFLKTLFDGLDIAAGQGHWFYWGEWFEWDVTVFSLFLLGKASFFLNIHGRLNKSKNILIRSQPPLERLAS